MTTLKLNSKKLAALIELSSNVKIYVPSTVNVSESTDNDEYVTKVLADLSGMFGGATSYNAVGCWISTTVKGLVKEHVTICQSYCNEDQLTGNIDRVIELCEWIKREMNQEAVSLEVNNKLYLV